MTRPSQRPAEGPTMLYRVGGMEKLHGVHVDYTIVEHHEVDDALAAGWHRTPAQAKLADEAALELAPTEPSTAKKVK